jgi:hypothetical protein
VTEIRGTKRGTGTSAAGRDQTVDVLRGYFILSMASGHIGAGLATSLLHVWRWVDGAAGFVCLSAFILGLVQRARWEKGAGEAASRWILRRAAQIWLVSLGLTVLALSLRLVQPGLTFIPDVFHGDQLADAAARVALLQLRVPYFGLLSMYVVFLLFAFAAVLALRRNLDWLVLGLSAALYVFTQWRLAGLPSDPALAAFSLPAWQLLFFVSLVVGWRWKDIILPAVRPWTAWIWTVSGLVLFGFLWLAHGYKVEALSLGIHPGDLTAWFDKYLLNPPVVVYFVALIAFLPAVVALIRRLPLGGRALAVVAMFGRHSLAGYVTLCLVQAATWIVAVPDSPHGGKSALWFVAFVALFAAYCVGSERARAAEKAPAGAVPV